MLGFNFDMITNNVLSSWSLLHCFWDPIYNAVAKIGTIELRVSNSDGKIYPNLHIGPIFLNSDRVALSYLIVAM